MFEILLTLLHYDVFIAELDCGPPEHVKYARVVVTSTWPGGRAEYHCNDGYIMSMPNNTRVCSEDGMWSEAPQCEGRRLSMLRA